MDGMKTWQALYGMIWIVLVEFLLAMTPGGGPVLIYAHMALGVGIIALAWMNFDGIRRTKAPARPKRIAKATFQLSVSMGILGVLLAGRIGADWGLFGITVYGIILLFHVVTAFAIITQAAATAIAYDMWEEREFEKDSEPGSVPEHPMAAQRRPAAKP